MKAGDLIARIELGFAFAFVAFIPNPGVFVSPADWINHLLRLAAFFLFLDGLNRFRSGIRQEIQARSAG